MRIKSLALDAIVAVSHACGSAERATEVHGTGGAVPGVMRSIFGKRGVIALWSLCALMFIGVLSYASPAQAFVCDQVTLKDASGVIGPLQRYKFSAHCTWTQYETKKSFGTGGFVSSSVTYSVAMDVVGAGRWDRKTGQATESLTIKGQGSTKVESGSFSGEWSATGTCNEDPFLKDAPGGSAVCNGMNVSVNVQGRYGLITVFLEPKRFLLEKKISLVEAQALSSQHPPPPAPPPPPEPKHQEALKRGAAPPVKAAPGAAAVSAKPKEALKRGAAPVKAAPGAAAVLAKPNLVIVSHQATVEPNCKALQPAMTVKVTIRNSGGPLLANTAAVYVKESGGTNLGNRPVALPALTAGQQYTVSLSLITSQPYSSLPGRHQLQVLFTPQTERGQPSFGRPTTPYVVNAAFPPKHCQPRRLGAAGDAPRPSGGLPRSASPAGG